MSPASDHAAIRAAYRALMRRYHPDAGSGGEAADRAREINEAYRVLGDPARRASYDESLAAHGPLRFEPESHAEPAGRRRSRLGPAMAMGFAALAAAMVAFAISPPVGTSSPPRAPVGEEDGRTAQVQAATAVSPASAPAPDDCSDRSVNGLVKEELFRRAQSGRADRARLEQVAADAVVRISSPLAKDGDAGAGCSGWLAIDLPRGLVVDGGRTNLNAEVAYGLVRAKSGRLRLASLSGADGLVRSLGTVGPEPREPDPPQAVETAAAEPAGTRIAKAAKRAPVAAASRKSRDLQPAEAGSACAGAASRAERIVCANANLSSLDRQLALLYRQSWRQADDGKKAALLGTRQRFNDRRDSCASSNCLTTAYVSRLKEISDIMAGKAQPRGD